MSLSFRWRIAALIGCAITISYFDRQTLPLAVTAIGHDIPISNTRFSDLQAAFLIAYAGMYALGGKLLDVLGTRSGYLIIMLWWSLASASHGLASSFAMLMASRFLLGMGEGGAFPAATKAIAEWFPVRERSLAMGIMNAGSAVGAVAAPPFIAVVLSVTNWRWVFYLSGLSGLIWLIWWWKDYWTPSAHPRLNATQKQGFENLLRDASSGGENAERVIPWIKLFSFVEVWGLILAKFISDAAWYFYIFWLPKYLYDARGFDVKQVGYFAWIPYAFAGVGCLVAGWFSGWLIRCGRSLDFSRKLTIGLSVAVMPCILLVTHVPVNFALLLFSIAFFGHQSWSTLVMVLPADLFPRSSVGSVAGLIGLGGSLGGMIFGLIVGYLLDHGFGYAVVFGIVSTMHITAFLLILLTVRRVAPLHLKS